jgi:hypothetical protein
MKPGTKKTWKIAAAVVVTAFAAGCMMHVAMPHAHPPAESEFGMGPRRSGGGAYTASLIVDGELALRKLQSVRVSVADSAGLPIEGATISVDGGMPQHGHGLPTQPRVTRSLGQGEYLVEGLRFNMGGWWVLNLAVDGRMGRDTVTFNLDL